MDPSQQELPNAASHSYLGDRLQELIAINFLNEGQTYEVLILPMPDVVLFPGETIPLRIQNRELTRRLGEFVESSRNGYHTVSLNFGILRVTYNRDDRSNVMDNYGTTIDIRSIGNNGNEDYDEFLLTAKGRQRFKKLSMKVVNGIYIAEVEILSDKSMFRVLHQPAYNPFPNCVFKPHFPSRLARHAYHLFEANSLWTVNNEFCFCTLPFPCLIMLVLGPSQWYPSVGISTN